MHALILAGGETPELLRDAIPNCPTERALMPVASRAMLSWTYNALRGVPDIERILVACGPETHAKLSEIASTAEYLEDEGGMMQNAVAGAKRLSGFNILLCTCDIPLATTGTFQALLDGVRARDLEGAYPIVERRDVERQYPNGKRTYARMGDGDFTAGNAIVCPRRVIDGSNTVFERFYQARKNPVAMARILGAKFLFKAVSRTLTSTEAERKMAEITGCRAGALRMTDAAIAWDVDKPAHLEVAEEELNRRDAETRR